MIIVNPTGGICNRIRVIASCISLQKYNLNTPKIKMRWEVNEMLNCSIKDLFQPIDNIDVITSHNFLNHFLFYYKKQSLPLKSKIKKTAYSFLTRKYKYFDDENIIQFIHNENFWKTNSNNLIINSCIDFYSPRLQNPYLFKPISKLENLINKQVEKFCKPIIGLHIRRTDNLKAIAKSKTEFFLRRISEKLVQDSHQLFFLATDDPNEEESIKSRFGNNIITQENKAFNRNSRKGIEDAVVDLFTLSKTQFIIGSYWSAFSRIAAGLGNIPLEEIIS